VARRRILVIRLGALGDLIQCFDAFHALRAHDREAELILLTKPAYAGFARTLPWFDAVWEDARARNPAHYLEMAARLRRSGLSAVYDLQNKGRTALYRRLLILMGGRVDWPGTVPDLTGLHNRDRYLARLRAAGIPEAGPADLSWLTADTAGLEPAGPFALLVPGCSPHLPHKRWPAPHYAELARELARRGITPVLVGAEADRDAADAILAGLSGGVLDLVGRTSLHQLAGLARRAVAAIGNDTGPVFLTAAVGCPTLMLMSHHTDPVRSAPWGPRTAWLKRDDLARLAVADVSRALETLIPPKASV